MSLALGIGAASGVSLAELTDLVDRALGELDPEDVDVVGTVSAKRAEPALRELCARRGWALTAFDADVLAGVDVPHPSERVRLEAGTPSVAEAAALLLGQVLIVGKTASARATVAVARR